MATVESSPARNGGVAGAPKGVLLTPAGRQFLAEAHNILLLIEQARRNTSAAGRGDMGELTVGFTMRGLQRRADADATIWLRFQRSRFACAS
jgi:hypothetical protein